MAEWWKKAVVYQIYPKSFYDTTGNGTGDLRGIIQKLDYLKELGVDVLWLTPVYESPQNDNGYDISNYHKIHEEYGTMEDFKELLHQVHKRGMRLIMDMVVNHTSTEHEWFQASRSSKENPYRSYYIWKDGKDGKEPNNWQSKFGGSAWKRDEKTGQYYLHLFDETQADLNWENPELRQKIYEMMRWWLDLGVDGFRLDVINLISKDQRFPDDDGSVPPGDGRKFYTDGPRIHEFMQEMNREVFSRYDIMTVGEMSSTTIPHCIQYTRPENRELNMVFQFHHLKVDYPGGKKWETGQMDFEALKRILSTWQTEMQKGGGWNTLFWCNHDQPRVVSRYGNDGPYHKESAKMLATAMYLMHGTPFIFQGEEIGMTNPDFTSIDDYRDVETRNMYHILREQGKTEEEVMQIIRQKSRDNARTPMQWTAGKHGGFTKGTPWIPVAPNYRQINVEQALKDKDSVFHHYKRLIQLRKEHDVLINGTFEPVQLDHPDVFSYLRHGRNEKWLVINNFFAHSTRWHLPSSHVLPEDWEGECVLSNYPDAPDHFREMTLRPYESLVFRLTKTNH
ncbi:alpha,alpha-phosphotrehalase [Thermoactinomyces intermedius]|uniref:Alpha,alpha-phosphotrehalase n=1 Tax=Thermoactinomyces intermedius TaxID=2024 RepID=A0A8I1DFS9_THEIN|nr:alpha,alpha-phosphotrehalase [Thermoactinomyces intermedius]MBA4835611.1 alpha,alpha-phosphotrehalase [Thermoactinomyces intermedius]MBH8596292.1 alpha,alpha-phosphotrehalase [Thermoactinomyces intermedius]MBH8600575.1 alpha,alpha-phosphotrehalase [Thermoactinomyces sp. CICC 23799]